MATDPEARANGNSGMVIAVVALILVVGLAVAFMTMRGDNTGDTTVVNPPSTTIIESPDASAAPDVDVDIMPDSGSTGDAAPAEDAAPAGDAAPAVE